MLAFSFVYSVLAQGNVGQILGNGTEETARQITDEVQREYLLSKWKETLLENRIVTGIDKMFVKLNPLIFFVFARDYSFSMEFFIVLFLWLAAFYILAGYADNFFDKGHLKFIVPFAGTILFAWVKLFNSLASVIYDFIFSTATSRLYSFFSGLIISVLIFAVVYINKIIAGKLKFDKKEDEQKKLKQKVELQERFNREAYS